MYNRAKFIGLICIFSIIFVGCAALYPTVSENEMNSADYGTFPNNYKEIIKMGYYQQKLKDPMSAVYRWIEKPYKGWMCRGTGYPVKFGYIVEVGINAKNSFGGYVGEEIEVFLLKNGKIIYEAFPITAKGKWFDKV